MDDISSVPRCADCGMPLPDEASTRLACPQCGSMNRIFDEGVCLVATAELSATGQVVPYPEVLLQTAGRLINDGQFGVAVVAAHMACEVVVEQSLHHAFAVRRVADLEEPVTSFLSGFNLANDRIRTLYTALTSDTVQERPFWAAFKASAERRNKAVHGRKQLGRAEAEESVRTAAELVKHVRTVTARLGRAPAEKSPAPDGRLL